ncbi:phosphopentomutase [Alicyclobacillus dauci]|uniref:Phosphopentomutase n=1 Tax=Alicyclobacillus dauci TaxID=1475485 RepID=A0ABY6Z841_9BACL|nr:phosphopentomutase [Alicyclobacillus dauci]WAH39057.1 phosphopentomutase [Alicyclobacillus dauci]
MDAKQKRWIWIVLDSCGIGAAPDAHAYGEDDVNSNTFKHVAAVVHGLDAPNLGRLGLSRIDQIDGVDSSHAIGGYGKMQEQSSGKDTTNGHWEFVGVILDKPMPTYPHGFPKEIIEPFEAHVGKPVLANKPASGTVVIEEYGDEHLRTGRPIVYTSADSVFQIAAHEDVVPVETLYEWCEYARSILTGEHAVGRVIARPFTGSKGHFERTDRRRDFSLTFGDTVLNSLQDSDVDVIGIGKIGDIYGGSGITEAVHTHDNTDGMNVLMKYMDSTDSGLLYANLVDFDSKYGHRNDPVGFARAIETFDAQLGELLGKLKDTDVLCITADHGCDPTTPGTDHTREFVPLLIYRPTMTQAVDLGTRGTFADLGATVADYFHVRNPRAGESFLNQIG